MAAKHKQIKNSDEYKAYTNFPSNVKKIATRDYNPIKSMGGVSTKQDDLADKKLKSMAKFMGNTKNMKLGTTGAIKKTVEGYNLEAKSVDIMTKAMEQSIDEDDSWKLWPSGTAGKRTAQMKAQAQDDSWKLTGTDAMRDLWYGPKKPKSVAKGTGKYGPANRYKPAKPLVTRDKTHLRNREIRDIQKRDMDIQKRDKQDDLADKKLKSMAKFMGNTKNMKLGTTGAIKFDEGPRDKTHLIKRQKAQAYAKQHARDPEDFQHDSAEDKYQQHQSQQAGVRAATDYRSDKKGVVATAKSVAQQNAVKKANKQNKAADAKLVSTLPFTKSVAKGTGAKGPAGGAKAPVSTVAKPGRIKMKIKKSDLFGKGSSKSTKPSDNTIDWNLGYDDEFGSKPVSGREKILKINKKTNTVKAPVSTVAKTGRTKMTLKKSDVPDFFFGKKSSKSRDDIFKGADLGHKGNWVESILHYSDAKGTPKYKEGYKAARKGVKYEDNPYKGSEKLQWSKGHNDWRADKLTRDGEPNYGARGQFENKR